VARVKCVLDNRRIGTTATATRRGSTTEYDLNNMNSSQWNGFEFWNCYEFTLLCALCEWVWINRLFARLVWKWLSWVALTCHSSEKLAWSWCRMLIVSFSRKRQLEFCTGIQLWAFCFLKNINKALNDIFNITLSPCLIMQQCELMHALRNWRNNLITVPAYNFMIMNDLRNILRQTLQVKPAIRKWKIDLFRKSLKYATYTSEIHSYEGKSMYKYTISK
jgi:hypothetical protein